MPVLFALMLNEVTQDKMKKFIQTSVYLPYFLSWVLLGSIFLSMLQLDGVVNYVIELFGGEPVMFMASNKWAPVIMVVTDVWKNFGYGSIIYLAALSGVDQELYEAAKIDGAGRWKQTVHITIPGIAPTIIIMLILTIGNLLNVAMEKVLLLYRPLTYETADVISTFVYRRGLIEGDFGYSTSVGLFNSVINMLLLFISNAISRKYSETSLF